MWSKFGKDRTGDQVPCSAGLLHAHGISSWSCTVPAGAGPAGAGPAVGEPASGPSFDAIALECLLCTCHGLCGMRGPRAQPYPASAITVRRHHHRSFVITAISAPVQLLKTLGSLCSVSHLRSLTSLFLNRSLANCTNPAGVQCLESQLSSPSWKETYNYSKGVFYLQSACELESFLFAKISQVYC